MIRNIIRIILIILLISTCYVIFGFSNQNAEESSSISRKITEMITDNINWIQEKPEEEKEKIISKIETIIRKIAHFSIYMIVGILVMTLLSTYNIKQKNRILYSTIFGFIYAVTDEIHQAFTPGRAPMVTDVIIDTMGVISGIFFVIIVIKIYNKIKK